MQIVICQCRNIKIHQYAHIPKGCSFPIPKLNISIKVSSALCFYDTIEHNHVIIHSNNLKILKNPETHSIAQQIHI